VYIVLLASLSVALSLSLLMVALALSWRLSLSLGGEAGGSGGRSLRCYCSYAGIQSSLTLASHVSDVM